MVSVKPRIAGALALCLLLQTDAIPVRAMGLSHAQSIPENVMLHDALTEPVTTAWHPLAEHVSARVRRWSTRRAVMATGLVGVGAIAYSVPHLTLWVSGIAAHGRWSTVAMNALLASPLVGMVWPRWFAQKGRDSTSFLNALNSLVSQNIDSGQFSLSQLRVNNKSLSRDEFNAFLVALNRRAPLGMYFERVDDTDMVLFEPKAMYYSRSLDPKTMDKSALRAHLHLAETASIENAIVDINKTMNIPVLIASHGERVDVERIRPASLRAAGRELAVVLQPQINVLRAQLQHAQRFLVRGEEIPTSVRASLQKPVKTIESYVGQFTHHPVKTLQDKEENIVTANHSRYLPLELLDLREIASTDLSRDVAMSSVKDAEDALHRMERYIRILSTLDKIVFIPGSHGLLDLDAYDHMPKPQKLSAAPSRALAERFDRRIAQTERVERLTLDDLKNADILDELVGELAEDGIDLARDIKNRLTDNGASLAVMGEHLNTRTLNGERTLAHMISVPLVNTTKIGAYFNIAGFTDTYKQALFDKIAEAVRHDHADADVALMANRVLITNVSDDWIAQHIPPLIEATRKDMQRYAPIGQGAEFANALSKLEFNRSAAALYTKETEVFYTLNIPTALFNWISKNLGGHEGYADHVMDHIQDRILDRITLQKLQKRYPHADARILGGEIYLHGLPMEWLDQELPEVLKKVHEQIVTELIPEMRLKERAKLRKQLSDLHFRDQYELNRWRVHPLDPESLDFRERLDYNKPTDSEKNYYAYDLYLSQRRQLLSESIRHWTSLETPQARQKAAILTALMLQDLFQRLNERLEVAEKASDKLEQALNRLLERQSKTPTLRNLDDALIHQLIHDLIEKGDYNTLNKLYKLLQEGRDKSVPVLRYDPTQPPAMPRISHYLPSWDETSPSPVVMQLRAALARLRHPERSSEDLAAFKRAYREYQLTVGIALVASTRDPRLEQAYKLSAINDVVEADDSGAYARFRTHLSGLSEKLSKNPETLSLEMARLIKNGARLIATMEPGVFLFKRAWGDELGFVVRDIHGYYYEAFCEVNKLNAYMATYKPDDADSAYHRIVLAFRDAAIRQNRRHPDRPLDFLNGLDIMIRSIAGESFNPTEKVPTDHGIERMRTFNIPGSGVPTHVLDRNGRFWVRNSRGKWVPDTRQGSYKADDYIAKLDLVAYSTTLSTARVYDPQPVLSGQIADNFDRFDKHIGFQKDNPRAIHEIINIHDLESGAVQNPSGTFTKGIFLYRSILRPLIKRILEAKPGEFFRFTPHPGNHPAEASA